jgi:ATP-dependent DNA helicase RecG
VGQERSTQLARLNLHTVGDLLLHAPRQYEDRRHLLRIGDLKLGMSATTRGRIVAMGVKTFRQRTRSVFEFVLEDGSGRLHCRWWNLPYMEKYFNSGDEVMVFGKVKLNKPRTMDHPETEVIETGEELSIHIDRIAPIYPLTEGLSQRWLRSLVFRVLGRFEEHITESVPELKLSEFPSRREAIRMLHFPVERADADRARERLAFDEFLQLQLAIQRRRRNLESHAQALPCGGDRNRLVKPFLQALGFSLTQAQTRVLRDIRADLSGRHPMRRLLQGDVGAGKTAVAACSALMTIESGYNVALMAPTEILATQHYDSFTRWFKPLGVAVEVQTGSRKTSTRTPDAPTLFIGTHALIESGFSIERLGLVIIDEQHKFGVSQREKLVRKGRYPHLLVMTATPIPRTLGLTVYGDLDSSVIDELPAGRGVIRTHIRTANDLPKVHRFIKEMLAKGRQGYVVYPRVDEEDLAAGIKAVSQEREKLAAYFAPYRVDLLHGRLPPEEKERVMTAFRNNQIQLLLATSVIEVGVDVPNATVMLIENADTFGLAQLHQLRGRIGRGAHESHCILIQSSGSAEARERLDILAGSTDGFAIAEADLKLRGPGEFLGQQQSGAPSLKFGDLSRHRHLIERARDVAREILGGSR